MRSQPDYREATSAETSAVAGLYHELLDCWNRRNAAAYAALFDEEGRVVGFDGSLMQGRAQIESELRRIFEHHQTAAYVSIIRGVTLLAPKVALLRAVGGMVPPGGSDINPAVNAIQTLIASQQDGEWRIVLFQNTPAQFHGRPELAAALSDELRQQLKQA